MRRSFFASVLASIGIAIPFLADNVLGSTDAGDPAIVGNVLYTIKAVPPPPFYSVGLSAGAINDLGQAVGPMSGNGTLGTYFYNGTTTVAGPLTSFNATGINDSSTICGSMNLPGGLSAAYTQNGTTVTTIGASNTRTMNPYGINNAGQVVGYGVDPNTGHNTAILYASGNFQSLGTIAPQTESEGFALNNQGDVVGIASGFGAGEPFIYTNGAMHEIGSVAGRALAVNDSRQIVGEINSGNNQAFYYNYTSNVFTTVAPPAGYTGDYLDGINNAGVAVGGFSNSSTNVAGIYLPGQSMVDLNTMIDPSSGWILQDAIAINNNGQILGDGLLNHTDTVFILTPISVPEPASMSLLTLGYAGILIRRRR